MRKADWTHEPELREHNAADDTLEQILDARSSLMRPATDALTLEYHALNELVGSIMPGDVWFVGAFSGNGKTSLLMNLVLRLLIAGKIVYYLGLESRPKTLRTHLACLRLGLPVGDVLSGAAKHWDNWEERRADILVDFDRQRTMGVGYKFLIDGRPAVNAAGLYAAFRDAALHRADLLIIDHIDHLQLEEGTIYEQSRKATHALLQQGQEFNLRVLVATQLNNEAARGDRLAIFQPPQAPHVFMGNHKRMIATGMLGLYRPLRADMRAEERKAVLEGRAEPKTILEPHTMGVVCMKHRHYGNREGQRAYLRIEHGEVTDLDPRDVEAIRTGSRA